MDKIILNGEYMKNKIFVHHYIKSQLDTREYHGNNLDALWDVLSTYSKPTRIILLNKEDLIENLGSYGQAIIKVFEDAAADNENIDFRIL